MCAGQCRTVWTVISECGMVPDSDSDVGQCQTVLRKVGQCLGVLRKVGQCWRVLRKVGQCWTVLASVAWALWVLYSAITQVTWLCHTMGKSWVYWCCICFCCRSRCFWRSTPAQHQCRTFGMCFDPQISAEMLARSRNIYMMLRPKESTQHTQPQNPLSTILFDARGLPRKYSHSRKFWYLLQDSVQKPNNNIDQLKVWSSTYKIFCDLQLTPTQQQGYNKPPAGFTTNTILVS